MDVHSETYTTTTTTKVTIKPYFDPSYVKTIPGIIKIVRMVIKSSFSCFLPSYNGLFSL